ncbi:ABC transporter ATP-binding protein [Microlunatus endophyticus]|uniref:ABC transporter ATP-binding protein n=1 Tax=Microlunatus endophyticus TaxID=1716077 RepID=A0A917W0Q2_9ACTN|nr:ABC transporter ATP-binding protein [Microlunatus endophyticus]
MRIAAGVSLPDSGSVASRPPTVSYLPPAFAPPALMRAGDYVTQLATIRGLPPATARRRAADLLEQLNLLPGPAARMGGLSTGNLRKVGIAQAFLINADLIVLDEPRAGLDPDARVVLDQLVRIAIVDGAAVITADHEPTAAGDDHRFRLSGGRLERVAAGSEDVRHFMITTVDPTGAPSTVRVADHERDRRLAELLASGWSVIGVQADAER